MLHEEAIALVEELGGQVEHVNRMRQILTGLLTGARQTSVFSSLVEAPTLVTLGAGATGSSFPPQPQTLGPEGQPTEERQAIGGGARRYEDLGLLGRGGMGEVRRVRDRDLGRTLAMKIASAELMSRPTSLARFIEEAQATAQLQHPGIIPVHELGQLPDGRYYFTMQEVRGKTLGDVTCEVHRASIGDRWQAAPSASGGWTFRRLVDAFHRACEAVAYAHERGVVHRDIKPENIMVGAHGEVFMLDWGIAKVTGRRDLAAEQGDLELWSLKPGPPEFRAPELRSPESRTTTRKLDLSRPEVKRLDAIVTDRSQDTAQATRMGAVSGTPAYMPPEQARGEIDRIDARSDIYALGAVLYELLSGRSPYVGTSSRKILQMVRSGPPEPVGRQVSEVESRAPGLEVPETRQGPPLPAELVEACDRAMARDPRDRFQSAAELAAVIRDWLDGARRREQALEMVDAAQAHGPESESLRRRAAASRAEAAGMLAGVQSWEPEEKKAAGWAKEDEAVALERQAALADLEVERGLQGALRVDPRLVEAHAALAERLRREHHSAESRRDDDAALRAEAGLRAHAGSLPEDHAIRVGCMAYLRGDGALTLVTDPPGAEVLLHRYVAQNRRLVPKFERSLGKTPLRRVTLPMGSYLCVLRHPDRGEGGPGEVRYPICIGRQEHWNGVRPGDRDPTPIILPRRGTLAPDDCYVPAGWFWSGGDPEAHQSLPRRRLWADAFRIKRFAVTNAEYIAFLDDLVAWGREDEALRHAPRERAGTAGELGALVYGRDGHGRFVLRPDADGDCWDAEWPVTMIDWRGALACSRWWAARAGLPWRLPGELEWEKAARGVDGRFFPWGDVLDPSWCCMSQSHQDVRLPALVDSYPIDESPFGVRGMGGNMRDWCASRFTIGGPGTTNDIASPADIEAEDTAARRSVRGGSWGQDDRLARVSCRVGLGPGFRSPNYGLRLICVGEDVR